MGRRSVLRVLLRAAAVFPLFWLFPLGALAGETKSTRKTIWIGDSRTVGMYCYVTQSPAEKEIFEEADDVGDVWIASGGQGCEWFKSRALPEAEKYIGAGSDVVILMGVNDVWKENPADAYCSLLNAETKAWKKTGARVFFVSVNPVRKPVNGIDSEKIEAMNSALIEGLSQDVTFIDTYTPFTGNIVFDDDVHYKRSTYQALYDYIKLVLENEPPR